MSKRQQLYSNDAVWASFYRDGKSLGEICKEFDCGVYDLSPWLMQPLTSAIRDATKPRPSKAPDTHKVNG